MRRCVGTRVQSTKCRAPHERPWASTSLGLEALERTMAPVSRFAVAVALMSLVACARPEPRARELSTTTSGGTLPSWRDGSSRALTTFVSRATTAGGPDFVPASERIAVFDNDGTLWAEQPAYVQLAFAVDRVKALAPQHPAWQTREPFKSAITGDLSPGVRRRARAPGNHRRVPCR
jgi:hypothetical protein